MSVVLIIDNCTDTNSSNYAPRFPNRRSLSNNLLKDLEIILVYSARNLVQFKSVKLIVQKKSHNAHRVIMNNLENKDSSNHIT